MIHSIRKYGLYDLYECVGLLELISVLCTLLFNLHFYCFSLLFMWKNK